MEITFKITEEMMQEAFQNALNNIEIQTCGMTLNECVEKQIPKKPVRGYDYDDAEDVTYSTIECPMCRYHDCNLEDSNDKKFNFCPKCGQKLDWSVEDGK